jgi:DeoR/GlpR family transcriptional regulator of sugar metabolism
MNTHNREEEILGLAVRDGEVSVDDLARRLGVSEMTIRRDLARLARAGRLNRTHGGAVLSRPAVIQFSFLEAENRHAAEKRAIAREAAQRVALGQSVALDTGTTTLEVARALAGVPGLTVLTSSLAIASVLHGRENLELVLLGGVARKHSPDLSGALTEQNAQLFRVHWAFLGADAVGPAGTFTTDFRVAGVSRALAARADRTVLVADHTKFHLTAFVRCVELTELDEVITDAGCAADVRAWLETAVPKVTYAPVDGGAGLAGGSHAR